MKVYTRNGDKGETGLLGGTRVPKYDLRIEAYGTVDELNSFLGMLRDTPGTQPEHALLQSIQERLFTLGSYLATDDENTKVFRPDLQEQDVVALELSIDSMEDGLPLLKNFVLPGGHISNSLAHVCRTICRRAERLVVHLAAEKPVEPLVISYLNRLSDWLFVYARTLTHRAKQLEVLWQPRKS